MRAEDVLGGGGFAVSARVVVNAAGVWAAQVQQLAGAHTFTVAPAKGVHLLVRAEAFDSTTGILARAEDSVIILRRWYGHWLLGTTDTPYEGDLRNPTAEPEDVDYLLRNVNTFLRRKIERADLLGTYAGLRPLLAPAGPGSAKTTSALSRDHAVIEAPQGMVTIVGGKYTTYRIMARDAVDAAARPLGRTLPPTPTATLPLVGAVGWRVVANRLPRLAAEYGVPEPTLRRMLHRYGDELPDVLAPIRDDPFAGRPDRRHRRLPAGGVPPRGHPRGRVDPRRRAQPAHPRRHRGARRRHRAARTRWPDSSRATLGWDETRQKEEVTAYDAQPRLARLV